MIKKECTCLEYYPEVGDRVYTEPKYGVIERLGLDEYRYMYIKLDDGTNCGIPESLFIWNNTNNLWERY